MTDATLRIGAVLAALAAAAVAFLAVLARVDPTLTSQFREDLLALETMTALIDREVLRLRAGMVQHYDGVTRLTVEARRLHRDLLERPRGFASWQGGSTEGELARVGALLLRKQNLLERFKAENAVLRNSRRYLPELLAELGKGPFSPAARGALSQTARALTLLDVTPASEATQALQDALDLLAAVEGQAEAGATAPNSILAADPALRLVRRHAAAILEHWSRVDGVVGELLDIPLGRALGELSQAYQTGVQTALERSRRLQIAWVALASAALGCLLGDVIARQRRTGRALTRARDALKASNQALAEERSKERALGEQKTRFVSATSHEFRTPLATILSSAEMLSRYRERWTAERRHVHYERIAASATHMTRMLSELLLIGRGEMGAIKPAPQWLDLRECCQRLLETQSLTAPGRTLELAFSGLARVWLDERLLVHILGNLLENATKYSDGRVTLEVSVSRDQVTLVVDDQGIGIPAAAQEHVFESFFRAGNVGAVTGSGLGLAAVQRAVLAQQGQIQLESIEGAGTVVEVKLPWRAPSSEAAAPSSPSFSA